MAKVNASHAASVKAEKPKKKKKLSKPAPLLPSWLFPVDNNEPAEQRSGEEAALEYLENQLGRALIPEAPPSHLLELIENFLTSNGFASTARLLSLECTARERKGFWPSKDEEESRGSHDLLEIYKAWDLETCSDPHLKWCVMPEEIEDGSPSNSDTTATSGSDSSSSDTDSDSHSVSSSSGKKSRNESPLKNSLLRSKKRTTKTSLSSSSSSSSSSSGDSDGKAVQDEPTSVEDSDASSGVSTSESSESESESSDSGSVDSEEEVPVPKQKLDGVAITNAKPLSSVLKIEGRLTKGRKGSDSSSTLKATSPLYQSTNKQSSSSFSSEASLGPGSTEALANPPTSQPSVLRKRKPDTAAEPTSEPTPKKLKKESKGRFQRIPSDTKIDPRMTSNAYVPYDYAERAHQDLITTKGKGFTKEKNKKKRGS
ncbi:hypothetical protein MMC10_011325 [Thelotrema lepadinum]|nr:hypothetical protein [Thelotrema lepadinum]